MILVNSGCFGGKKTDPTAGLSETEIFGKAKNALSRNEFEEAVELLQKLEARYPFGNYAKQGRLDMAYAHYKFGNYEEAEAVLDRYMREHPNGPALDYALYMKGLINTSFKRGIVGNLFPKNPAQHDSSYILIGFNAFSRIVKEFPDSRYAPDAGQRLVYLRNALAEHELLTAKYYFERQAFVAAVNRAQFLLERYPEAPATIEALAVLAESYEKLGLSEAAQRVERVRAVNAQP